MALNTTLPRPMFVLAMICVYWIWWLRPNAPSPVNPVALTWPIIVLVTLPMLVEVLVGPIKGFYISSSFRGLFESRTDFSFLAGIAVLAIVLNQKNCSGFCCHSVCQRSRSQAADQGAGVGGIYHMADGERRVMVLIEILSKPIAVRVAPASLRKTS
jgi:hypothetical protein